MSGKSPKTNSKPLATEKHGGFPIFSGRFAARFIAAKVRFTSSDSTKESLLEAQTPTRVIAKPAIYSD